MLVEINEADPGDTNWPFSGQVYILTTNDPAIVLAAAAELHPTETSTGWAAGTPPGAPVLPPGCHVLSLWWD